MRRYLLNSTYSILFFLVLVLFPSQNTRAGGGGDGEFNAGHLIIDHVIDSHEWHIISIGEKHISVPLPIIILEDGKITAFMSSRFEHGHAAYKNYELHTSGKHKGKIVKVNNDGTVDENAKIYDFSITKNTLALFISVFLISILFIRISRRYQKNPLSSPKGIQSLIEPLILFVRDDIAKSSIGPKYERYLPFLLTMFFFILINNLIGLIPIFPGGANLTGNITVCMILALFTFLVTTFTGNKNYWAHIFNTPGVPWWLKVPMPLMPIIEILGALTKPFVLMVRLFANITAGHIIALGFISLILIFGQISAAAAYGISIISVLLYVFIGMLELLVAFLQAYVFTLLSALYFGMAVEEHHHEHEHDHVHEHAHENH